MQSETTTGSSSRLLWADFVRNIGILLVILGHVSTMIVVRWRDVSYADWTAGHIYNILARSCVPLLFMVSGALLLPRWESIRDFYRKRFKKVIFPFLFWSLLYILWKGNGFPGMDLLTILKGIVVIFVTKPAEYHLWFMYELFGLYLITPILRVLVSATRDEYLWYFMGIWFVFGPLQQILEFLVGYQLIFELGYLTGYVGYYLLGYLLARIPIRKWMVWVALAVYLAAAVVTGAATLHYTIINGRLSNYFQNLLGINIVFLAISAFVLLKAAGDRLFSVPRPRLAKWAVGLTSASFGMYLIHVFVLNFLGSPYEYALRLGLPQNLAAFLQHASISPLTGPAIYMVPVTTLLVFLISWVLIAILQKIPGLRSLVA